MINLSDYKKSIKTLFDDPDTSEFDQTTVALVKRGKAYRAKRSAKHIVANATQSDVTFGRIGFKR